MGMPLTGGTVAFTQKEMELVERSEHVQCLLQPALSKAMLARGWGEARGMAGQPVRRLPQTSGQAIALTGSRAEVRRGATSRTKGWFWVFTAGSLAGIYHQRVSPLRVPDCPDEDERV